MDGQTINVVVFREEDMWVAHCVQYDICAQASDLQMLKRRLETTIELDLEESLRRHGIAFAGIGPAPQYIQDRWLSDRGEFTSTGSARVDHEDRATVDYQPGRRAATR